MKSTIKKAIKNPSKIFPELGRRVYQSTDVLFRRVKATLFVKRVVVNNETFFEYRGKRYPEYLHRGNALSFIIGKAQKYCRGQGLDIGPNRWTFPGAIPVRDEPRQNAYQLDNFPDRTLDYILSSHCLEHLQNWQKALKLWISKLRPKGILFLYLPHPDQELWHPGAPWVGWGHKWIPEPGVIKNFLIENGVEIVEISSEPDQYWSFHIVGQKKE